MTIAAAVMRFYDFDQIGQAAADAESGAAVKAVLRMTSSGAGPERRPG